MSPYAVRLSCSIGIVSFVALAVLLACLRVTCHVPYIGLGLGTAFLIFVNATSNSTRA